MVLEETLVMYDPDEARRIAGALWKKRIPIRIARKDILIQSVDVIGRIRDVKAAIEERMHAVCRSDRARGFWPRAHVCKPHRGLGPCSRYREQGCTPNEVRRTGRPWPPAYQPSWRC